MTTAFPRQANPDKIVHELRLEALNRLGFQDRRFWRRFSSRLMMLALPRFAEIMSEFDRRVAVDGFAEGIKWLLPYLQVDVTSIGAHQVPVDGPVLLASNHPGGADFCAIFSQIPRGDGRLVAAVEQLDLLPNVVPHIVYSSRTRGKKRKRGETTRKLIGELQDGNCVLLYPRGKMEPDPRWVSGARQCLPLWRSSITRFAEAVPDLTIVPTCVSGSVSRKALDMRWLNLFSSERYKQRTAIFVQMAMSMIRPKKWNVKPLVQFGPPIRVSEHNLEEIRPLVLSEVNRLMTYARAPEWPIRSRTFGWLDK